LLQLERLRTILAFTAAKLSKILKIESPLNWSTISETSDLLLAGHQIGEEFIIRQN
jgi:hypothetical protein